MASVAVDNASCKVPQVNLSKISPSTPADDPDWVSARSKVMSALETSGCVEIVSDKITPGLWEAVFHSAVTAFEVSMETKMRNTNPDCPFKADYVNMPEISYESTIIKSCDDRERVGQASTLILGESENEASFCETIHAFSTRLKEMEEMVRKMVFESYKVSKYWDSHKKSIDPCLRMSHYWPPENKTAIVNLGAHTDGGFTSLVCQNRIKGLEVLASNGSDWITLPPKSITFLVGDLLSVFSNGRLKATSHRVMTDGNQDRYSVLYFSVAEDDFLIMPAKELVDEVHPLMYKPFYSKDYLQFRLSKEGQVADPLKVFCGLSG